MSRLDELIAELCPDGVPFKKIKEVYTRIKGTPITASKMKEIEDPDGEIRIFAGGKTVINAREHNIPNANITRVPAVLVQSRGVIDAVYYDKPFTFKNEMWAYTNESQISVKYLYYVLKNNVEYFRAAASGMGSLPQISLPVTEDFIVPVPPLPVQQEIVRILDRFTELTAELQKQLDAELTARKKQYEYYRDKLFESLALDNSVTVYNMGDVLTFINGRAYKQQELLDAGKYPVLRVGNFYTNNSWYYSDLELSEDKYCDNGDLLYSWAATLGPKIWNGRKCIFHYHIWKIIFDETIIDKNYLYYYLQYDLSEIAKSTTQSTMVHVSMDSMKKRRLRIPPIDVQRRMAARIKEFDSLLSSVSSGLPAEIAARQKQYEYYRDKLLAFKRISI